VRADTRRTTPGDRIGTLCGGNESGGKHDPYLDALGAATMELAVSYLFLRRAVGLIGALLPFALPLGYSLSTGRWRLLASVSSYYYTDMRNVLVGSMCAVGVFLVCYRYRRWDDVFATIGGVCAIGVAMCPTRPADASRWAAAVGVLHVVFAALFLVNMALISWFLFTLSDRPAGLRTAGKNARNLVYRVCAVLVVVFTAGAGLSSFTSQAFADAVHPLFWCEALATFSFGVAWFVKGETLLRDEVAGAPGSVAAASLPRRPEEA
jgi:hypothetical protein